MSVPTRDATSRASTQHPDLTDDGMTLSVDTSGLPASMEPVWVRETYLGATDHNNISRKLKAGYVPVTTDMLPQARSKTLAQIEAELRGEKYVAVNSIVREGGMVLMMRPKDIAAREHAAAHRAAKEAERDALRISGKKVDGQDVSLDGEYYQEMKPVLQEEVARSQRPSSKAGRFPDA